MGVQTEHDAAEDGDGGEDHGLELDDVGVHELGEDGEELHVLEEDGEGHHERDEQDDVVHHELVGDGEELHGEDEQGHGRVQDDGEDHERHDEAYEWEMRGEGLHEPGQDDAELREGARDLEEDEGEDPPSSDLQPALPQQNIGMQSIIINQIKLIIFSSQAL